MIELNVVYVLYDGQQGIVNQTIFDYRNWSPLFFLFKKKKERKIRCIENNVATVGILVFNIRVFNGSIDDHTYQKKGGFTQNVCVYRIHIYVTMAFAHSNRKGHIAYQSLLSMNVQTYCYTDTHTLTRTNTQ